MAFLSIEEQKKIHYVLDLLAIQERLSAKFVKYIREGLYEIRVTKKTLENEIQKALVIQKEYYESK
jgi:hypothetical protein